MVVSDYSWMASTRTKTSYFFFKTYNVSLTRCEPTAQILNNVLMKPPLLILLCLKAKTHPMALNVVLFSFTCKHDCRSTVSQSWFSPLLEILTCFGEFTPQSNLSSTTFSGTNTSKHGHQSCKSHPAFYFPFPCPHITFPDIRKGPSWQMVTQQAPSAPICFRKWAGLALVALCFKARCLTLDIWIDGLILSLSEHQFPIGRLYVCSMLFTE